MTENADYESSHKLPVDRPTQLRHLINTLNLDPTSPLFSKAKRIVETMVDLWQRNGGHFERNDVDVIQGLVVRELSPEEFTKIAVLSFATWATPDRLSGLGLPHLNRANQCLAQHIAALANPGWEQTGITLLDLGAGLLGTTESVVEALVPLDISLDVTAVESSPTLVETAHYRAEKLLNYYPNLRLKIYQEDMLDYLRAAPVGIADFITIVFAIHHLHPVDQLALLVEARRVLKSPGALLVADPQDGKSDFNLNVLIYEEPEAVFAAFTSPESMRHMMTEAGFTSIEVLMRDDSGYEAYVIRGLT